MAMEVAQFSNCLNRILLENEFVNIPGLGCFLTELVPAAFSDKGATINPPYKKLFFREINKEDGDIFLKYLALDLPDYEDPAETLDNFVNSFKVELNKKKNIRLGSLGTMRATSQNDYFFVASEDLDIYPEGFGLQPIAIKTHIDFTEVIKPQQEIQPDSQVEPQLEPQQEIQQAPQPEPVPVSVPVAPVRTKPAKHNTETTIVIVLVVLIALLVFFMVVYIFQDSAFSETVRNAVENILYHLLYTKEELSLLGR